MSRFWSLLTDVRVLSVLGFLALAAFLFIGADALSVALTWAAIALGAALLIALAVWGVRRWRARRAAAQLEQALDQQADRAAAKAPKGAKAEVDALRERLSSAVKTIKTSKLGQLTGSAALYELPWYMVIGNPAAGKSTAVVRSGLKFPFAEQTDNIIQGIGGTRNCDWFFTSEGILLDTAGRYAVHEEDREEWRGFLSLLKKHRPKAPINGIIIAASVTDVTGRPDAAITLAKQLRQRVQELTEQLEVFAPVYVVFTKADLIAGFAEFFEDRDPNERDRVWGSTLPYQADGKADAIAQFDNRFDELFAGLKEMSVARMAMHRGEGLPPGVLTFPLEFAALKPALRSFVGTLFEENPYQYAPVFRGFYFTSSVQEGSSNSRASERIAQQFALDLKPRTTAAVYSHNGFFLKDLFQKVIFADRHLVRQHASRTKVQLRYAVFAGSVVVLGLALGGRVWSYAGNQQLLANVDADIAKAVKLQKDRTDLQSRIEALGILQDRIEQLQAWHAHRPAGVSLGLYQGDAVEHKLREEYFDGVREVMLQPVAEAIQVYLTDVNANGEHLQPMTQPPASGAQALKVSTTAGTYQSASTESVEDAYNALKTYLMLSDRQHLEPGHLADQITRFWRGWLEANRGTMPREQLIASAERMLSFTLAQTADPEFPQIKPNLTLVDTTRENLRRVVRGMPARERVYEEIKARAATRFAPMTVARIVSEQDRNVVAGSYSISGAFTKEAWNQYVQPAIKDAANKELQSTDWVLKTSTHDDLTLEGSPEQIQKQLVQMYKTEYVAEWQKFLRGITVQEFGSFDAAVARMNRLGDPANSPVYKVLDTLYEQTSWDNPSVLNEKLKNSQRGFMQWFKQTILRQAPSRVEVDLKMGEGPNAEVPMGPIGKEFAGVSRLMAEHDNNGSLAKSYLGQLSKIRTKFNQIKNQGDPGPAARTLMAQTLDGSGSDLSEALRFVDEQMLTGMSDSAKASLRPLLVRPLMQAFATLVPAAESEVNRVWTAQVYEPFERSLSGKYPFDVDSKVEAAPAEIAKVFGPDGAIAKFQGDTLGALVLRRGDEITPRQWAEMGVRLNADFTTQFAHWVAPLSGAGAGGGGGAAAAGQTRFQIQPMPVPGLSEYTIDIDGQQLRYRNSAPTWSDFTWPGPKPGTGVRISGVAFDGRTVEFFSEPGGFGLERMVAAAQRKRLEPSLFEMAWPKDALAVRVKLRIISTPADVSAQQGASAESASGASSLRGMKLPPAVVQTVPTPEAGTAPASPASHTVVAQGEGQ